MPLAENCALGIAIMSYDGRIDFGLLGDYDALPELDDIAAALEASIAELADVAGVGVAATPDPAGARGTRRRAIVPGSLPPLTLALAQIDPRVGDLEGNVGASASTSRGRARPAPSWSSSPSSR